MAFQVKIGSVSQTKKFLSAEGIIKLKINRPFGIMSTVGFGHFQFMHFVHINSNFFHPGQHFVFPIFKIFLPFFRPDKIFQLHLFKFSRPKQKIPRGNFVPERLANLGNTERQFRVIGVYGIFKINEDALSRFRPEIRGSNFIFLGANLRLKHGIESAAIQRVRKIGHMAGGLPDFFVHENSRAQAIHIPAGGDEFLPPRSFEIIEDFSA